MGLGIYSGYNLDMTKLFQLPTFSAGSSTVTNPLFTTTNPAVQYAASPSVNGGSGRSNTTESDVAKYIKNLVNNNDLKSKFSQKVGNSNTTYAQRLIALMEDYATSDNSPLTKAQYNKIKSIACSFHYCGAYLLEENPEKIDALKAIVEATINDELGSTVDEAEEVAAQEVVEQEAEDAKEEACKPVAREDRWATAHNDSTTVTTAVDKFYSAMDGAGTNKGKMREGIKQTTKYNIIEVLDKFEIRASYSDTLLTRILNDCDNWNGSNDNGGLGHLFCHDSAREFVQQISDCLKERAEYINSLPNAKANDISISTSELDRVLGELNELKQGAKWTQEQKTALETAFNELVTNIKNAENVLYIQE